MGGNSSLVLQDFEQIYNSERMKFLASKRWEQAQNEFLRKLKQNAAAKDVEEIKTFARAYWKEVLATFEKTWLCPIWNRCFIRQLNDFDTALFMRKLMAINEGCDEEIDLTAFFVYKCMTEMIDNFLSYLLEYETRQRTASINANNIVIVNGEVVIKNKEKEEERKETDSCEHLDNIIFNGRLFDSDQRLTELRNAIVSFINLGEDNGKLTPPSANQIEPSSQNEWYYIEIAIAEAEICTPRKPSDVKFTDQMISWFPWLFHFDTPEEMKTFKRKFEKSLSAERSIWKYGQNKEVTAIKDMWPRQRTLRIDYAKLSRLHPIAEGLKQRLTALKTDIVKENHSR